MGWPAPRYGTSWPRRSRGGRSGLWPWSKNIIHHKTAIFRQVNLASLHAHHDALEFPDGEIALLTHLMEGQEAVVLQLPVTGSKAPQRAAYV